jgi:hypothetical protein
MSFCPQVSSFVPEYAVLYPFFCPQVFTRVDCFVPRYAILYPGMCSMVPRFAVLSLGMQFCTLVCSFVPSTYVVCMLLMAITYVAQASKQFPFCNFSKWISFLKVSIYNGSASMKYIHGSSIFSCCVTFLGVSDPLCLSSSLALHFLRLFFLNYHLVNRDDWHLLAHALASDLLCNLLQFGQ